MKKSTVQLYSNLLLLICLFSFGCEKSANTDQERDEISQEVRKSLEGEILFSRINSIYKVTAKSGGTGTLIGTKNYEPVGQKWSPDGSKMAYIKFIELGNDCFLVITDQNGINQHEWLLGTFSSLSPLRDLTWSPDGTTIAVLSNNKIIYVKIVSGNLTTYQLVPKPGFGFSSLAWWPKGNKIAVSEGRESLFSSEDGNQYIWMLEAYEKDPHQAPSQLLVKNTDPSILTIEYLDWSMDGTMLTYSGSGTGSIYIVQSDGTGNQKITSKHPFEHYAVHGFAPCWMSNNEQIIYVGVSGVSGSSLILGLFVTDIHGTYNVDLQITGLYPDCY